MKFIRFINKFVRSILYLILNRDNKKIKILANNLLMSKFHLLDIGAAGDINNRWNQIKQNITLSLVEPHKESASDLKKKGHTIIEKIFYSKKNLNLTFYKTDKPTCSGILKPNLKHVTNYPESERFKILDKIEFVTTTIDDEFKLNNVPHFIKMDTQGSELEILNGSVNSLKNVLGLEIECEFFHLYENQPLFFEIKGFLEDHDFEFIDFLRTVRWERYKHRYTGQPQISDVLFLKKPNLILEKFKRNEIKEEILFKYYVILIIYNRADLIKFLNDNLNSDIVNKFELHNIHNFVEKKVININRIRKYSSALEDLVNNLLSSK